MPVKTGTRNAIRPYKFWILVTRNKQLLSP